MEPTDLLAALRREADAFAAAVAVGGPDAPVTSCPGWTLSDLLWHLTEVHDFWCTVVAQRLSDPGAYLQPDRPVDHEDLLEMYRLGADALLETLTSTPASTPVWTWAEDRTAGFVVRRMAHETAVHRWDAEMAAGSSVTPVEPELASDGIDEFLVHLAGHARPQGSAVQPVGGSTHLHCTDVRGEWLVVDGDHGALRTTREHAKGDCAIRGEASNLLLALWRRIPLSELEVIGDATVAERFIAHTSAS